MSATKPVHDISASLQLALANHQRGQLDLARQEYEAILRNAPQHADSLHLLGVVERQQGNARRAVALIEQAIAIAPGQATMHCNLGAAWQDLGQPQQALASYDTALALTPAYALAWSNRGNSLRQLGRLEEACASYQRALTLRADYPEALCNLAISLHALGRDEQALAAAAQALVLRPRYADALCASGNALLGMARYEEAAEQFSAALAIDARNAPAWCWRGIALQKLGRCEEAVDSYGQATRLRPGFADAFQFMGNALRALGRDDAAVDAWRQALALGGDSAALNFAIAALTGVHPAAAPASYVSALFDEYAERFDDHLVGQLDYRTPALIGAALDGLGLPGGLDTVDLGCGTGLCAPVLRPRSRTLAGVDLSGKMLDKARGRGGYDVLACADAAGWLGEHSVSFDLVVAADVLVYIGDLAPLFRQVHGALRGAGWFACSVEAHAGDGYVLQPSSRYAHALGYIEAVAAKSSMRVHAALPAVLRRDHGEAVHGHVLLLQKLLLQKT
jgi:predicted TPR repeat methyltransferase